MTVNRMMVLAASVIFAVACAAAPTNSEAALRDKLNEVNAGLRRLGSDCTDFRLAATHTVTSPKTLSDGSFSDIKTREGTPLVVGEMSPVGKDDGRRAVFIVASGDPLGGASVVRTVAVRPCEGCELRVLTGKGEILPNREADGTYTFQLAERSGALVVSEPTKLWKTSSEKVTLPLYDERKGGWLRGWRPKEIIAHECTVRWALDPASVRVKTEDGRELTAGGEFAIEPSWGTIGLTQAGRGYLGKPLIITYTVRIRRLDSLVERPDGMTAVRRGVPHVHQCAPAKLLPGDRLVATRLVTPGREEIFPVTETGAQAPRAKGTASETIPKTLAKLQRGEPVKILAWGDSVTVGTFVPPGMKWQEQFVSRLRKRYPKSEITLVSNAWGGRNTHAYLNEPEGSKYNYQKTVLGVRPDLIVSEFVNDSGLSEAKFKEIYPRLLKDFRVAGIEWIALTPHYVRGDWMGLTSQKNCSDDPRPYVKRLRAFAAENKIGLADASLRWGHLWKEGIPYETLFVNDINHPNAFGMSLFADALMTFFGETL